MASNPNQTPELDQTTDVSSASAAKPPVPPPPQQGFTILALVGILGLVLVFLALGYWVITQDFGLAPRLLLGAAGICLALFFWFNPGSLGSIFSTKGVRYGGNTLILVAALIGIVIVLNLLAGRFVLAQADLTTNGQYTLSDQTQQILRNLDKDISVHAFFTAQNANRDQADQLLRQYKALSSHFTYEMVDPNQDPLKARSYQISQDGSVVFTLNNATSCQVAADCQSIYNVAESDFSGAIITLLTPTEHTVYFLTGHGEHSITSSTTDPTTTDQTSYSTVNTNLARDRYATQTLNLSNVSTIAITGTTTLIIAGPQKPLSDPDIAKINQFLASGGRVMILADPPFENPSVQDGKATIASLNKILAPYGSSLGTGVILDQAAAQAGSDPSVIVVNQYENSTITNRFNGFNALLPVADAIFTDQPVITDTNVTRTPLLLSSSTSALYSTLTASGQCCDTSQSTPGPLNLAASLDYGATSGAALPVDRKHTRLVVVGDSDFAVNTLVGSGQYVNGDLFLNAVNWLNESDQLSGITPKTADTRFMTLTQTDANVVFYSSVLALPIVVLIIGAAIWWRRR